MRLNGRNAEDLLVCGKRLFKFDGKTILLYEDHRTIFDIRKAGKFMSFAEAMQLIGAVGTGLFYPIQNWRAFVTRKPIGLSFLAFSVIAVSVGGYLSLGLHLKAPIFWGLNASNLVFAILLLVLLWFWSRTLSIKERVAGLLVMATGFSTLAAVNILFEQNAAAISGWIGLAGIVGFYAIQNAQLFIKRDPTGLSFVAFASLFVGLCGLTAFGVFISDTTVILGNGITALGTLPILWGILRWKKA